jgi:hypothetical protein
MQAPLLRELGHQSEKAVPQGVRRRAGLADQEIVRLEGIRFQVGKLDAARGL